MSFTPKPGIDWEEIKQRLANGETATAVARDHDVTRQAITKRAKKEGWLQASGAATNGATKVVTADAKEGVQRSVRTSDT